MPFLDNIGAGEMLIIGIVFILLFGGKKMKEMARDLGESTKELKTTKQEWEKTINATSEEVDKATKEIKESIKTALDVEKKDQNA